MLFENLVAAAADIRFTKSVFVRAYKPTVAAIPIKLNINITISVGLFSFVSYLLWLIKQDEKEKKNKEDIDEKE